MTKEVIAPSSPPISFKKRKQEVLNFPTLLPSKKEKVDHPDGTTPEKEKLEFPQQQNDMNDEAAKDEFHHSTSESVYNYRTLKEENSDESEEEEEEGQ